MTIPYYVHIIAAVVILYFAHAQLVCWMIYTNRVRHPEIVGTPLMGGCALPLWILEFALAGIVLIPSLLFIPVACAAYATYRGYLMFQVGRAQYPFHDFAPGESLATEQNRIGTDHLMAAVLWTGLAAFGFWRFYHP